MIRGPKYKFINWKLIIIYLTNKQSQLCIREGKGAVLGFLSRLEASTFVPYVPEEPGRQCSMGWGEPWGPVASNGHTG